DQNPSLDVEHPGAQKTCRSSEHKRLKTGNCGNKSGNVKQSRENANMNDMEDDHDESSYSTTIAGRLCRTRLPIARF
ncbi:unnamed protein product, partial [Rotaria magnacalcarata]